MLARKGNCRRDDDTIIIMIIKTIICLSQRCNTNNQGIKGTSSGTYIHSVTETHTISLCAVFTKGGELDHKPTDHSTSPLPSHLSSRHAHTHIPTHPHTLTHTKNTQGTDEDKRAQVQLCRFDGCACKSGTGNIRKIKLRGAS